MNLRSHAPGIGALADDTRRELYQYVVAQPTPVGRREAAGALGLAVHTAGFHLDRLTEAGLLVTEFRRLSGRAGPGAGRPSKLYRRADQQFAVTLPERRYDVAGQILAAGVERAVAGTPLPRALAEAARETGLAAGRTSAAEGGTATQRTGEPRVPPEDATSSDLSPVADALARHGFEPRTENDALVLANCPFDVLAQDHRELICGLNRDFVQGVADGVGCPAAARLDPGAGRCCVSVGAVSPGRGPSAGPDGG
jgi:predicted ArsR family transcriptional regulator